MTDNQFLLQCRDMELLGMKGEVGLDLDVYSMSTDRTRDVKTLSGRRILHGGAGNGLRDGGCNPEYGREGQY